MAQIVCPRCNAPFDNNSTESLVTRGAAAAVGAGMGAWFGAGVGIAGGPLGAISGLAPGPVLGGVTFWFTADQFRRCPGCGHFFET